METEAKTMCGGVTPVGRNPEAPSLPVSNEYKSFGIRKANNGYIVDANLCHGHGVYVFHDVNAALKFIAEGIL